MNEQLLKMTLDITTIMSIDDMRAMLVYYEKIEAYEICHHLQELIKAEERDIKLKELGILCNTEIPQKSGI